MRKKEKQVEERETKRDRMKKERRKKWPRLLTVVLLVTCRNE